MSGRPGLLPPHAAENRSVLWVTGGRQAEPAGTFDRDHRRLYAEPVLVSIAVDGTVERIAVSAPGRRFGGLATDGDHVFACTDRAIVTLDAEAAVRSVVTHPWLADVHHVASFDGVHFAASTAAGGVVRFGSDVSFVPTDPGSDGTRRFEPSASHPNYVFAIDGTVFVTRGRTGDAVALDGSRRFAIADVVVHDGVPSPDGVWFTAVDGRLILVDPRSGLPIHTVALHVPERDGPEPLGWCRGLVILGDVAIVGFTRIRATRLRSNLAWVRGRLRGKPYATRRATRLVAVRLPTGERLWEAELAETGLDAVFGVLVAPGWRGAQPPW